VVSNLAADPGTLSDAQYSGGSPYGALCGRGDLDPEHPRLSGCYDTKVTCLRHLASASTQVCESPSMRCSWVTVADFVSARLVWLSGKLKLLFFAFESNYYFLTRR